MKFKSFVRINKIPETLHEFLDNKKLRCININHTSGDLVYNVEGNYILKISTNKERLKREKVVNDYLLRKLPVSKSVMYVEDEKYAYYVKTKLIGTTLASKTYLKAPRKLAKLLKIAIDMVHGIDTSDCDIISSESKGNTFVHGDFCLPNILAKGNKIVGFVDVEAAGKGDAWFDYAWCIWSFEYNLGSKEYTNTLLNELKIKFDEEKFLEYTRSE